MGEIAMKKTPTQKRLMLALFVVITMLTLQFQGFSYKPGIITKHMPEAISGSFYYARFSAEGFGKNTLWTVEGLPYGLRVEPGSGVVFGTAENPGIYEVFVTVKSKKNREMWSDSRKFLLNVLPRAAGEQVVHAAPEPKPQAQADAETPALPLNTGLPKVEWLDLQANGISGLETTTVLYLDFSEEIPGPLLEFDVLKDNIKIIRMTDEAIEVKAAKVISLSEPKDGITARELYIKDIDESLKDGDEVKVVIEFNFPGFYDLSPNTRTVRLKIASDDFIKATEDINALALDGILGGNTSAGSLTSNLSLPDSGPVHGRAISWQSSNSGIISDSGVITRPGYSEGDKSVILTATIPCGARTATRDFSFTVKALPEILLPELPHEIPPEALPVIALPQSSGRESGSGTSGKSPDSGVRTSSNVEKSGAVSRTSAARELEAAFKAAEGKKAVIKTQNAKSISPKTLKTLAMAADENGKQAVLYADTLTPRGSVDARLYIKPAILLEATEEIRLGISTKGKRPDNLKRFFEKYFDNEVSVISCEQQGDFGARLQIAAKVELPEDAGKLVFYSYDSKSNSFSRIITAYRVDANGYLRFSTKKAGDLVISNGALKRKAA